MIWLDWLIIASLVLLAVIFRQWRQRGRLVNKLDLQARKMGPVRATAGDAERDQRLVEAWRGAGVKRMFPIATSASSRYRHKFEQIMQGAGGEEASLWETITALAFAVQAKAPYGLEHFQEVSKLAAQIAMQMRLSEAEIEEVRVAAIVHDIGKTHVPDHVRLNPKLLTAEEFEIMKSHAAWGARILEPLKEEGIESIVRHHHERYDGEGYPDRLKGEDIPLGARIVAVAECFDYMVSGHPYTGARTFEDAIDEIRCCSGTQFDPKVVTAFLRLPPQRQPANV